MYIHKRTPESIIIVICVRGIGGGVQTGKMGERERKKAAGGLGEKDLSFSHPHIIVVGVATTVQQIYH